MSEISDLRAALEERDRRLEEQLEALRERVGHKPSAREQDAENRRLISSGLAASAAEREAKRRGEGGEAA